MMKDWTGGVKSAYACIGANNHSDSVREANDYYATDPKCVDDLLARESFSTNVWECACGEGHISKKLEDAGYNVFSTDLIDRGYGIPDVDFLKQEGNGDLDYDIITNPPYKYATEFVNKALSIVGEGHRVAMFLKLTFLEGKNRYDRLFKATPPIMCMYIPSVLYARKTASLTKHLRELSLTHGTFGIKVLTGSRSYGG